MTRNPESSRLSRLWTAVIEASAAAVAIHYATPWCGPETSRDDSRRRDDGRSCAA